MYYKNRFAGASLNLNDRIGNVINTIHNLQNNLFT